MIIRSDWHIHSEYSPDSNSKIDDILKTAKKENKTSEAEKFLNEYLTAIEKYVSKPVYDRKLADRDTFRICCGIRIPLASCGPLRSPQKRQSL